MGKYEYFFGWRQTFGTIYPVRWVEDDGEVVGGKFDVLAKHRITKEEYLSKTRDLELKYPYQEVKEESRQQQ